MALVNAVVNIVDLKASMKNELYLKIKPEIKPKLSYNMNLFPKI